MPLLDDIRTAVRVSPVPVADKSGAEPDANGWEPTYASDYDGEIVDLIYAALADLTRAGVRPALLDPEDMDPLAKLAVKTYAKAHFGYDNAERSEFVASYESIVTDLKNASYSNVEFWRTSMADCAVEPVADQPLSGPTARPVPTVTFDGEELEPGRDFRVRYSGNDRPGTATAYIEGTGSYAGVAAVEFEVVGA